MRISFLFLVFFFPIGSSFILDQAAAPLSGLGQLVEAQHEKRVSIGLNIAEPGEPSRLAINGIVFDLMRHAPSSNTDFTEMPGRQWPRASFTGGLRMLNIVEDGSFVSMRGKEIVKPLKGCWEIIWREGDPSGSLYCGLEIDQAYKRNDATLPKGMVYISFNTWSSEGLKKAQATKERSTERADMALKHKQEELSKMAETNNILQKGLHYYKALCAVDEYLMEPNLKMRGVPSDEEVVHFGGDMHVSKIGKVWSQDNPKGKPVTIGTVGLELISKEM